jgi:LPS-assembly protein
MSPTLSANTQWQRCDIKTETSSNYSPSEDLQADDIYVEADQALLRDEGLSTLRGDVVIIKGANQLFSDSASFDRLAEDVIAKGNVRLSTETLKLKSDQIAFNLANNNGTIKNAYYQVITKKGDNDGRGQSRLIENKGKQRSELYNADYSTCPVETPSWNISSSKISLDHQKEIGTARNITLNVGKNNIPIFYFPYFSFPLSDNRKSGFLTPTYKSSESSGLGISVPYYFNLAPNYDYTLTPTLLSNRGLMLGNEFRYLTDNHNGILNYEVLLQDSKRNNETRYQYNVQHFSKLTERTHLKLEAEGVSDSDYFDDLSGTLQASSRTALKRQLDISSYGKNWDFLGRIQNYQLLDGGLEPYARLPQLNFNYHPQQNFFGADFSIKTEFVNFDKKNAGNEPTGSRFDINTKISRHFGEEGYFIKPSLGLRHTQYDLDLHGATGETKPSRTLATASIDSGLYFERDYQQGKKVQTLEPRLFYTKTPYKDQSNIPIFDTAANSFSYNQLFSENRFSGKDRVEDADRLSASLTTRALDKETGDERFRASIGQIFHFNDRKVTLPSENLQSNSYSELAIEFSGQFIKNTRISSVSLWDASTKDFQSGTLQLHYKDDKNRIVNAGYRYRQDELEQSNLSLSLPVQKNWSVVASWDHDLQNNRDLENVIGVEYGNCCVKSRLVARRYLTSDNNTYDKALFAEFEFKGLGSVGDSAKRILEDRIYGYD